MYIIVALLFGMMFCNGALGDLNYAYSYRG